MTPVSRGSLPVGHPVFPDHSRNATRVFFAGLEPGYFACGTKCKTIPTGKVFVTSDMG